VGIEVKLKTIVGDDRTRIEECLRDAIERSDVVLTTGGLGPTADDITRECAAKATGRELVYLVELESALRDRFRGWGREMPEINKRQAYVIKGSDVLPNPNGSASGMYLALGHKALVLLPGPPRENQPMFDDHVLPRLRQIAGDVHVSRRVIKVAGMGESAVDEIAQPIYSRYEGVETSILFNRTEVEIHIAARGGNEAEASDTSARLARELELALGRAVFSTDGESMEQVIGHLLKQRGQTLSLAESCTGGLVARRITEVPGASDYFTEGAVTYANEAKVARLGVLPETLDKFGAVSSQCAEEMASGMRLMAGTDHAVSVTGIAGPGGGTDEKPVGTVWIGYAGQGVVNSVKVVLPGDRYLIRWRASQSALDYLRRQLLSL
jgi:nicotinamide-nucleotide amidase